MKKSSFNLLILSVLLIVMAPLVTRGENNVADFINGTMIGVGIAIGCYALYRFAVERKLSK